MGFLDNKKILVTGLLSNRSIAYGIAKAMRREGAQLAFSFQGERIKDRVVDLAAEFDSRLVLPCDVASDAEVDALFAELARQWDGLDGIVHSIAFAPREALAGDYLESVTREAFRIAHEISSLQLCRTRQSRFADDARPQGRAAHAHLPRRAARLPQLQRDGPGQGKPGSQRALYGAKPRAQGHPGERDFSGSDQDARRRRYQQLR